MRLPAALPHIDGRRGTVIRLLYWALAAATVLVVAGSVIFNALDFFRNVPATLGYGFRTYTAFHRVQIGEVSGPGARAAGLERGRWLTAINGEPLPADATEYWVGAKLAAGGAAVTLSVRDDARRVTRHRLPRVDTVWTATEPSSGLPVWAYTGLSFASLEVFPLFLLAASILLALRRPRDPEAMLFAVGFLLLCYSSDVTFWLNSLGRVAPGLLNLVTGIGWIAILLAAAGFPDGRFANLSARLVPAGLLAIFAWLLIGVPLGIAPGWVEWGAKVAGLALIAITAFAVIHRYRHTEDTAQRQQVKWVAMGFVVAAIVAISVVPVEMLGISARRGDAFAFLLFVAGRLLLFLPLPIGLLVSLLRYRLYDADAAISRSAAYAVLTVTLLAIFAITEKAVEILGAEYLGGSLGSVAGGIGAALAAVAIAPLHHRLTHWAEHRFQKTVVRLRTGLPALVGDLRETAGVATIADAVLARVEAGVRSAHAALLLDDALLATRDIAPGAVADWRRGWIASEDDAAQCDRDDPVFPMRVPLSADGPGRIGWLLLGPRPDGSFYGRDERAALIDIADPIARALAIARERAARTEQAAREARGLMARIDGLEAAMARLLGGQAVERGTR